MNPDMSIVQDALHIPELLLNILSFTDTGTLPAAALVCRSWYPNALDLIWRDCFFFDLLQTFCPLTYEEVTETWDFDGYGDSERYLKHASRVVHLRHDDTQVRKSQQLVCASNLAFHAIMTLEPNYPVGADATHFPNIQSIRLSCSHSASLLQMIPLVLRAPQLAEIDIRFVESRWTPSSLRSLNTLAGALPATVTRIRVHVRSTNDNVPDLHHFIKKLSCGTKLSHIGFEEQDISPVMGETLAQFSALRTLEFGIKNETMLQPLLATLAHTASCLQDVRLHTTCDFIEENMPFDRFRSLLQLPHLTTLYILHDYTVLINEDDITAMGHAWPRMETLHFPSAVGAGNPNPDPGIPLRWLSVFARELPHLRALSIYFDNFKNLPSADDTIARLSRLKILAVGSSNSHSIGTLREVVEFLAGACPPGVTIVSDRLYRTRLQSAFEAHQETDSMPFWNDVSDWMKVVHRTEAAAVRRAV